MAYRAQLGRLGGSRWGLVLQIKLPCRAIQERERENVGLYQITARRRTRGLFDRRDPNFRATRTGKSEGIYKLVYRQDDDDRIRET